MALDGLKRRYGDSKRKKPVTIAMLNRIRDYLQPRESREGAMLWAAILLAFMFLLRASEYTCETGIGVPIGPRGLRGEDVVARCDGVITKHFEKADELVLTVRGSKTDKFNRGETRNHFKTSDPALCVVTAMAWYQKAAPDRFIAPGSREALFVHANGRALQREEVQAMLRWSASEELLDPEDYGSHSLRFGGASALWASFHDSGLVQRWGRWASNCFQGYVWESRQASRGVADRMVQADFAPV